MTPAEAYSAYLHRSEVLRLPVPRTVARLGALCALAALKREIFEAFPEWHWPLASEGYTLEAYKEDTRL